MAQVAELRMAERESERQKELERESEKKKELERESERQKELERESERQKELEEESERPNQMDREGSEMNEAQSDLGQEGIVPVGPLSEEEDEERHTISKVYRRQVWAATVMVEEYLKARPHEASPEWTVSGLLNEMSQGSRVSRPVAEVPPWKSVSAASFPTARAAAAGEQPTLLAAGVAQLEAWEEDPGWWDQPPLQDVLVNAVHPPWVVEQWERAAREAADAEQVQEPMAVPHGRRPRRRQGKKSKATPAPPQFWD